MEDGGNNRSVMPFDVPGCTRATLIGRVSRDGGVLYQNQGAGVKPRSLTGTTCLNRPGPRGFGQSANSYRDGARPLLATTFGLKRGISRKRRSSACVDYVPALCTHRPSLLPIGCAGEVFGLAAEGGLHHLLPRSSLNPPT